MDTVGRQGQTYLWEDYNGALRKNIQNFNIDDPNHKIGDVGFSKIT